MKWFSLNRHVSTGRLKTLKFKRAISKVAQKYILCFQYKLFPRLFHVEWFRQWKWKELIHQIAFRQFSIFKSVWKMIEKLKEVGLIFQSTKCFYALTVKFFRYFEYWHQANEYGELNRATNAAFHSFDHWFCVAPTWNIHIFLKYS